MWYYNYKNYDFWCDIGMMTPLQYKKMIDLLEYWKPKRICELGSGQSTEIFEKYCNIHNASTYSIEHDKYYNTKKSIVMMSLIENTQLNINECLYDNCTLYKGLEDWLVNQNKFDFVLIDGPNDTMPNNVNNLNYSRIQLLSFLLLDKLSDNSIILYHDSNAQMANNTISEFEKKIYFKNFSYIKECLKEQDKQVIDYNQKILGICPELTIFSLKKKTIS